MPKFAIGDLVQVRETRRGEFTEYHSYMTTNYFLVIDIVDICGPAYLLFDASQERKITDATLKYSDYFYEDSLILVSRFVV